MIYIEILERCQAVCIVMDRQDPNSGPVVPEKIHFIFRIQALTKCLSKSFLEFVSLGLLYGVFLGSAIFLDSLLGFYFLNNVF